MKIKEPILIFCCLILISGCFPVTYFLDEKCKIGAGTPLFAYYLINIPPVKFDSIYSKLKSSKHILFPDTLVVERIVNRINHNRALLKMDTITEKYTLADYYNDTVVHILTNKDRDFLYTVERRFILDRPYKTSIIVTGVSTSSDIYFRALGFSYKDKRKATKDFENDILPYFKR